MPPRVTYQLRIALRGTKPPIWRRVLVSPSMTLDVLHRLLQTVMGWEDCHLHMFVKGRRRFSVPSPWDDDFRMPGTPRDLDEREYGIGQVLTHENDWMTYKYDFGGSWHHRVTLQKILPYDPAVRLPACIGGKRRCPPEDCGGVWGYYENLEIMKDPEHPEHEHIKEWMGGRFDPDVFSARAVDMVLGQMPW